MKRLQGVFVTFGCDLRTRLGPLYNGLYRGMFRTIWVFIALLPLSAQNAGKDTVEQGRKEFEKACGFCHGADATGSRAPDLIRSPLVNRDRNGDLIGPVILGGRPDKGMPPLPLDNTQIAQITAFLHARLKQAMASNKVPNDYPEQ